MALMAIVVFGVIVFAAVDYFTSKNKADDYEHFDDPIEKHTNRDMHGTNRVFLTTIGEETLGNNNLQTVGKLLGKEDDDIERIQDTSLFYQQDKNLSVIHDTSTNIIVSGGN